MAFNLSKWWRPGFARPSTFQFVGWAKAAPAPDVVPCVRSPVPTLRALAFLLACVPITASAQSVEEKAQACAACHGENGIPADPSWPAIWGQYQGYLYLQLRDFKSGTRKSDVMGPVVQDLSRDDMLAIALYFSQKAWPNLSQPRAAAAVAARAAQTNTSVGCTGCHQAGYKGEGTQPRLAGQNADYLAKTMMDFRTHTRGNNPGMSDLMNATSEDELKAMAAYLGGL
jgi:cytochrome c553